MADARERKTYVFHGSYRQMQDHLDGIFKEVMRFECSGELDRGSLEQHIHDARLAFEHWVEVTRAHADEAEPLQLHPHKLAVAQELHGHSAEQSLPPTSTLHL